MLTKDKITKLLSSKIVDISPMEIPHFRELKNIDIATKRIIKAIQNKQKIVAVGDYDVDGVVASTIIAQFFQKIGYPIEIVIPNRFEEGYGLTPKLLNKIDCDIIITLDNGISSYEASQICQKRGIELIITDHHTPTYPMPKAYTIINPKQKGETFPFREICGAEVAWYLCASINSALNSKIDMREFLDYLVLAIIADVMPLNHLNRILVKMGLAKLSKSTKPFAITLREFFNKKEFNSEDVAFNIAPRINSAGRMDSAYNAYYFLNSTNLSMAKRYFDILNQTNKQRKDIEQKITSTAIQQANQKHFIVASGEFHEGVVGIVASRLVEHFKLPAIVFSDKGELLKGSGRSLGDVNIYSLISDCAELLEGFGGHKLACGLSIKKENLDKFTHKINTLAQKLPSDYFYLDEFILGELPLIECDFELVDILKQFEPYGEANPRPKFTAKVNIETIKHIKDNHFRLTISQNNIYKDAIIFGYDGEFTDRCEIVFTIRENNFNSNKNIQLLIQKITPILD
jgi:single-stranded-DNA-specific exonuclease